MPCEDPREIGPGPNSSNLQPFKAGVREGRWSDSLMAIVVAALWVFYCSVMLLVATWIAHIVFPRV